MQNKFGELMEDIEGTIQEEEREQSDSTNREENKIKYLTTLKNIERLCLKKRFGSVAECGDFIATNKKDKLVYVHNKDIEIKHNDVEEIRKNLREYYGIVRELLKPEYQLRYEDVNQIKLGLIKVRDYCVSYGFYGKALEASKVLGKTFKFDEIETVKRVIKGYGQRQIINGEDQSRKVQVVKNNARRGVYGYKAKELTNTVADKLYKNISVEIKNKKFTLQDWEKAISKVVM